jgi:hypothetical protein
VAPAAPPSTSWRSPPPNAALHATIAADAVLAPAAWRTARPAPPYIVPDAPADVATLPSARTAATGLIAHSSSADPTGTS